MAFIASQVPLQRGFEQAVIEAFHAKQTLEYWNTKLNGDITSIDAINWLEYLNRVLGVFSATSNLPGISGYAQTQFGSDTYNVIAEFSAMVSALTNVQTWLRNNIPSNSVSIVDGVLVGQSYAPATTSALKALVNAAIASIE